MIVLFLVPVMLILDGRSHRAWRKRPAGFVLYRLLVQLCARGRRLHFHASNGGRCSGRLWHEQGTCPAVIDPIKLFKYNLNI